jgi:hypothetical protein
MTLEEKSVGFEPALRGWKGVFDEDTLDSLTVIQIFGEVSIKTLPLMKILSRNGDFNAEMKSFVKVIKTSHFPQHWRQTSMSHSLVVRALKNSIKIILFG